MQVLWFFPCSIVPEKLSLEEVLDDPSLKQNFDFSPFIQPALQWSMAWHQLIIYFPFTSGRCRSVNKRATCLVVMLSMSIVPEFWLCRLWNKWAPRWFSQEIEQCKTQTPEVANHTEYPLEAKFATCMVFFLTFLPWWVNCLCLKMECKNCGHSFKSYCQTNYDPPGKQLGNFRCACMPSSLQKTSFIHSAILLFTEKLRGALWNLSWRTVDRLIDDELDMVTTIGLMLIFLYFICTIGYAFALSTRGSGTFKNSKFWTIEHLSRNIAFWVNLTYLYNLAEFLGLFIWIFAFLPVFSSAICSQEFEILLI